MDTSRFSGIWYDVFFLFSTTLGLFYIIFSIRQRENWELIVLKSMALMYMVGKGLQLNLIGPGIVRWYMADLGFVGMAIIVIPFGRIPWEKAIFYGRVSTSVLFYLAIVAEVFTLQFKITEPSTTLMARGDYVDLTIFVISYGFVMYLLWRLAVKHVPSVAVPAAPMRKSAKFKNKKRLFRP